MIFRSKVNVIVINPVKGDSQPILRALKKARKQGIKIIAVDTQLKHLSRISIVSRQLPSRSLDCERADETLFKCSDPSLGAQGDCFGRYADSGI